MNYVPNQQPGKQRPFMYHKYTGSELTYWIVYTIYDYHV